jgi:uncharacterized protein (DUF433 family)
MAGIHRKDYNSFGRKSIILTSSITMDTYNPTLIIQTMPQSFAPDADGVVRVGNTRITLDTVIIAFNEGATAEEIAFQYPSLNLSDIYSVISYYLRHNKDIDKYLQKRHKQAETIRRRNEEKFDPSGIRDRLLARKTKSG